MILLCLGIANLYRALQRQTLNRHSQILQAFSFFLEYRDVRVEDAKVISQLLEHNQDDELMEGTDQSELTRTLWEVQEVHYNLGRAFHGIGLFSLAVHHYMKVLNDYPDTENYEYNLKPPAAYNLQLIYNVSGNMKLSRHIIDQYLVI